MPPSALPCAREKIHQSPDALVDFERGRHVVLDDGSLGNGETIGHNRFLVIHEAIFKRTELRAPQHMLHVHLGEHLMLLSE